MIAFTIGMPLLCHCYVVCDQARRKEKEERKIRMAVQRERDRLAGRSSSPGGSGGGSGGGSLRHGGSTGSPSPRQYDGRTSSGPAGSRLAVPRPASASSHSVFVPLGLNAIVYSPGGAV